ncbi:MAG TPA: alpha/beta hydrolase [Stellaceae bacterium]|nr:alpha/beta hydrolase [Stellaceae bacterium]
MIFLHSTPDDHRLWMFQTAHFSAWYRTIAVDLAGYGRSPAPQDGVTMANQAEAVWELVDTITSGPVILQGNSMGSEVAMHMADQRPQRTAAMILSGCGYLPDIRDIQLRSKEAYRTEGIARRRHQVLFHFSPRMRETALVQHYADMVCALSNAGTLESIILMNEALASAKPDLYPRLDVPCLIISGSEDMSRPSGLKLQTFIKGCELVTIEGAGHANCFEMPWEFDRICIEYLTKRGLFPG